MPSYRTGTDDSILAERPGLQRVTVDGERAYVLTQLVGPVRLGDRVVVNTTAVDLGLGTGGWHVVHWNLAHDRLDLPGAGHIMKLRYTSLQVDVATADDGPGLPPGTPVVACALLSQVACAAHAFKHHRPDARLTFVMTDSAALPLALADVVHDLRAAAVLDSTITVGQAFGGDVEAVNLRAALDVVGEGAVIVGPGPGVVGTGTRFGYSGFEVAGIVDTAGAAGGVPIVALRVSDADPRPRHRGVSHHSATVLAECRQDALVALPPGEPRPDGLDDRHQIVFADVPDFRSLAITSMGRAYDEDPRFFDYAGAAGAAAAIRLP